MANFAGYRPLLCVLSPWKEKFVQWVMLTLTGPPCELSARQFIQEYKCPLTESELMAYWKKVV